MDYLKRTWTSMKRKPLQSILMFLIVFVLGNVLFASIAVKQTSENVRLEMRSRMPSYLTILITNDNQSERIQPKMQQFIKELSENENILKIKTIESARFLCPEKQSEYDPYQSEDGYIISSNTFLKLSDIDDAIYDYEIKEGRFYTQEELVNGEYKIVLEDWQRYVYDFSPNGEYEISKIYNVGDTIKFSLYNYKVVEKHVSNSMAYTDVIADLDNLVEIEFEIIGIVNRTLKDEYDYDNFYLHGYEISAACIDEMIELQSEAINKHPEEEREKYRLHYDYYITTTTSLDAVEITAKGIDASEKLQDEILNNQNYQKSYYKMISSVEDYRYIQAPLENLVALANVALGASIFLVIALLSLVSILFIRKRTKEVGILMSLGERKSKILLQFVFEILLVGLLATSFSMISGSYLGEVISKEFMKIQIDADYELQYQEKNPETVTQLDLLDAYEVEITTDYILTIYGVSTLVLIISSMAPIIYILRVEPKKILM